MDIATGGVYVFLFIGLYFEVFLLISFLEKRPSLKSANAPARYPSVAMLVPCFNEEATIGKTLESLLALDYPKQQLSILVINDGSTDGTGAVARAYAEKYPQIEYFEKKNGGKYTALNYGIARTQAELIGCLDADSFVAKDALLEVAKRFESDPKIYALTPAMKVYRPRTLLELMQAVEYTFGIFFKKMFDNLSAISVLPGPFSLYRREVFEKIGLFKHAHNTEDMEIAFRMHLHGLKIANAHTAHVYTTVPRTVRTLLKQRTRWSQGFLQNSQDYSFMYFKRRYGNFGMLVLPFGLTAFFAGLYTAAYALYQLVQYVTTHALNLFFTGIPLHLPQFENFAWQYLNTGMMPFLVLTLLACTCVAILLGARIGNVALGPKAIVSYFLLFGFLAPLWLARAAWGTLRAQESTWR